MPDLESADLRGQSERSYNLGDTAAKSGQTEEAVLRFREAIRLWPDSFDAHYRLIDLLTPPSQSPKSDIQELRLELLNLCRHALTLDASNQKLQTWILRTCGYAEAELGRNQEAMATMRALTDANPEDIWAYETLQQLQFRTGDWIGSMRTTKALNDIASYEFSLPPLCKRRLLAYALLVTGGVLLAGYAWHHRSS